MRLILLSIVAALAVAGSFYKMSASTTQSAVPQHIRDAYAHWKASQNRFYATGSEDVYRLSVFAANYNKIQAHNLKRSSFKMELGRFADLSEAEFKAQYLNHDMLDASSLPLLESGKVTTSSFDWRDHGAVNPVRDQGHCGSCWAFSTVANVEGVQVAQKNSSLPQLSEQQLVDCSRRDNGCHGGLPSRAMGEFIQNGWGFMNRDSYAYTGREGTCRYDSSEVVSHITSAGRVADNDEAMMGALQRYGPLTVAVYAPPLQHYRSGIFDEYCGGRIDHAVVLVGFGTENGQEYWIVRNSWTANWGEQGYFRLPRNENKCSINYMVVTAVA